MVIVEMRKVQGHECEYVCMCCVCVCVCWGVWEAPECVDLGLLAFPWMCGYRTSHPPDAWSKDQMLSARTRCPPTAKYQHHLSSEGKLGAGPESRSYKTLFSGPAIVIDNRSRSLLWHRELWSFLPRKKLRSAIKFGSHQLHPWEIWTPT